MVPQLLHSCGRQRGVPSLRPTATRVVSSSKRSPRVDTGRAFSQAPDSFLLAARRRARDLASGASSSRAWAEALTLGESHSLWRWDTESGGGGLLCPCDQQLNASSLATIGNFCKCLGIIWATRVEEPAADARKAEGASWTALLMPSPPFLTGREAWGHAVTELWRELLVMLLVMDFSRSRLPNYSAPS